MKKLILIAPNSFKECASSVEIARLIRDGLEKYIPNSQLIVKPISDGGDGFLEVCQFYFGGNIIHYKISTPYDDLSFDCPVLYNPDNKKLYIESAEVLGLKIIPQKYRKPMYLSSKGMGELLLQINDNIDDHKIDCREIIIGIGGTGTVDMGLGMCSQLGMLFLDTNGNLVTGRCLQTGPCRPSEESGQRLWAQFPHPPRDGRAGDQRRAEAGRAHRRRCG